MEHITLPEPGFSWIDRYLDLPPATQLNLEEFEIMWESRPIEHGTVKIGGRIIDVPRWQKSYGRTYYFSGQSHTAEPVPNNSFLEELQDWVNAREPYPYQQVLINWYDSAQGHYISAHSDNEGQLIPGSSIYSFSYGEERDFVVKGKQNDYRLVLPMPHNSLLIMGGEMQKYYTHAVPKRAKLHGRRINVTLRAFRE